MPLLDIRHLTIEFKTSEGWVKAVDRVSLTLTDSEYPRLDLQGPLVATAGLAQAPGHRAVAPRRH